jgi:hypothetical protein
MWPGYVTAFAFIVLGAFSKSERTHALLAGAVAVMSLAFAAVSFEPALPSPG